jgi:hypothetical protein
LKSRSGDLVNQDWLTITCVINCPPGEALRQLEEMAVKEIAPDHIIVRTVQCGDIHHETYRFGDYFESVDMYPDESTGTIQMTFHARQGVDSHWKGLLMAVLRSIGKSAPGISVEFPHKST